MELAEIFKNWLKGIVKYNSYTFYIFNIVFMSKTIYRNGMPHVVKNDYVLAEGETTSPAINPDVVEAEVTTEETTTEETTTEVTDDLQDEVNSMDPSQATTEEDLAKDVITPEETVTEPQV